ncbi:MAG: HD-GYP domain-containing protein [Treponema sp.]|nr:HD-GYP domain-containing protein [Treponema sp.]MCL2252137.1 HD-GYP domain-containing protein [Treponema sp.]
MNVISTNDLRPGQIFTMPVYTQGTNLLVPANVPLRQKDINLLVSWGIDVVKTEGELIVEEETVIDTELENEDIFDTDEFDVLKGLRFDNNTIDEEEEPEGEDEFNRILEEEEPELQDFSGIAEEPKKQTIKFSISDVRINSGPYRAYKNLIEKLNSVFTGLKSGLDIEMRMIDNISVLLLQGLRDYPDSFVGFILGGEVSGHELAKSSVNTAILSALTAHELKLPNHKVHNIVSGALLHDIGMLRLSKGITEKKGGLSEAELEQIKSHPLHTSKIVTKELFGPHEVNLIALQHHERWDGQGYPDMLVGQTIDIGARIVSAADAFEAMVSKKSYRPSLSGYQAVKNLLADNARRFDPAVISAFTKIMGIYPIGSIVRLNDESIARVTRVHISAPMRPVVQLLMDKYKKVINPGETPTIDLLADKTLFIRQAIDPTEFNESN